MKKRKDALYSVVYLDLLKAKKITETGFIQNYLTGINFAKNPPT